MPRRIASIQRVCLVLVLGKAAPTSDLHYIVWVDNLKHWEKFLAGSVVKMN